MNVAGITSSSCSNVAALQSKTQQATANLEKLTQSLQSGDLTGAQQAFAALQPGTAQGQGNPLQKQADALGQALQSGNVAAAQQAFAALQSAAQAQAGQGGGGGAGGGSSSSSSTTVVSETSTTSANGTITTVITYSNGTQATTTAYGPPPVSSQSITV